MPLRVLHADGGIDGPGQTKVGHVADDQLAPVACGQQSIPQKFDVVRGQVEADHLVAPVGQAGEVRTGSAGDVQDPPDGPPGVALEGVDQEVHLPLAVHVEGDLVELGRAVHRQTYSAHHVSSASRITQEAAMPVRPVGSHAWATSTRSPPTTRQSPSSRTSSISSGTRRPPGSGEPVPGASEGSSTSTSIVT